MLSAAAPALFAATLATAAPAPPPAPSPAHRPPPSPPTDVSGVTIYPVTAPPKLVSSYPAAGAAVAPGVTVLKLTFDQKMSPSRFDIGPLVAPAEAGAAATAAPKAETPPCLKVPRLLDDGKTFVLLCTLRAGRSYGLSLNASPPDGVTGFANATETRAAAAALSFTTTRDEPIRSLADAMRLQGLTPLQAPVQETPSN